MAKRSFTQQYHDETVKQGKSLRNPDGSITTVFSMTVQSPEDGLWYNVPGFNREEQRKLNSDDEALALSLPAIRAGKVKSFKTAEAAVKAATEEHKELDMPEDTRGLMQRLFDKSGDELEKIEGTPDGDQELQPTAPTETPKEKAERERIEERVRQFRIKEGRDPQAGASGKALLGEGEFDEFASEYDPALHHLQGDTPATDREERHMKQVVKGATDFVYGEAMPKVLNAMRTQPELYIGASMTTFEIVKREHTRFQEAGEQPEPAVFFAETGAVPVVYDALWDLAKAANLPGSSDQDQYAGGMINLYRLIGQNLVEEGDEDALKEAEEVAISMAMTNPDGSSMENENVASSAKQNNLQRKQLAGSIGTALLGETV